MDDETITLFSTYLERSLGIRPSLCPYLKADSFPLSLKQSYAIQECMLLGKKFLALFAHSSDNTPSEIEKQSQWIKQKTALHSIFVLPELSAYVRTQLIEKKIPFIVPNVQLYLPDLGLDLRENIKQKNRVSSKIFPASQVIVLAYLLKRMQMHMGFSANTLAQQFGYSRMTMSRALDELGALSLVSRNIEGRYGEYRFNIHGEQLWEKVLPQLRSPVIKRNYIIGSFPAADFLCGESALAQKTMLAYSGSNSWAFTSQAFEAILKSKDIQVIPKLYKAMDTAEIELWQYDPQLLADKSCVDPLSLYLSFYSNNPDERIALALDELVRGVTW